MLPEKLGNIFLDSRVIGYAGYENLTLLDNKRLILIGTAFFYLLMKTQ